MAKGYYENLYNDLFKGSNKIGNKVSTSPTQSKLDTNLKKIDNLKTRLEAGGVEVKEDNRNAIEKFLGLPDDQNIVFDFFELLGRPQQALFGAIEAAQEGEDIGKAAWENFKGDNDTQFKDILMNTGAFNDEKGKINLVDVLGFTGDVLLDPADLALIPVTGGTNLAVSAAADAGKTAGKVANAVDAASDIAKGSNVVRKSLSDLAFETVGKGVKGAVKTGDKGIEKVLKHLDKTKGVKNYAGDVTKIVYDTPTAKAAANLGKKALTEAGEKIPTNAFGRFEAYKDMKDTFGKLFDTTKNIPKKVMEKLRKTDAETAEIAMALKPIRDRLDNNIRSYAQKIVDKTGENIDDVIKRVDNDLNLVQEGLNLNRKIKGKDLIKEAMSGKLSAADAGDDGIKLLNSLANDIKPSGLSLDMSVNITDDGMIKLGDGWKEISPNKRKLNTLKAKYGEDYANRIDNLVFDSNKLNQEIVKRGNYTAEDLKRIEELSKDADFMKLYEDSKNVFNEANSIINKVYGSKMPTGEDNLGYVRHAFNKEQFDAYKNAGFLPKNADFKTIGSTTVLSDRTYNMSAREANNIWKQQALKNADNWKPEQKEMYEKILNGDGIFKEGLLTSFDDFLNNVPREVGQAKKLDEVLVKASFSDYDELSRIDTQIRKAHKANDLNKVAELKAKKAEMLDNSSIKVLSKSDSVVPRGYRQMTTDEIKMLEAKLNKLGTEFNIDELKNLGKKISSRGQKLAINEDLLRLVEVSADTKQVKGFARLYDGFMNFFKRNKVLSPTFQMNNIVGNTSNMYLAGISPTRQAQLFPQAANIMSKSQDVLYKHAQGIALDAAEQEIYDIWSGFLKAGFGDPKSMTAFDLADMPESLRGYFTGEKQLKNVKDFLVDGLPYLNNKLNNQWDTMSRLATYIEGINNPKFLQKLGVDNAGDAVRKVLFDPKDLTTFEQKWMKKIMPFYTFTKKNLAFQVDNLSRNGGQYHKLFKAQDSLLNAATGGEDENVADWLRNNFYIPIPALGPNGEYTVIRANMPVGSLVETITDPIGSLVGMLNPMMKTPIEWSTNTNSFTGQEISSFPGEKSTNIPFLTKEQEYLLGTFTGLDVPLKNAFRFGQGVQDGGLLGGIKDVTTMEQNINTDALYKSYEDLERLENLMQQYKQAGYEFSSINELKAANKNTAIDNVMAKLNKLNGVK